jgi:tyrosine-protein kinase Etk/Wzc
LNKKAKNQDELFDVKGFFLVFYEYWYVFVLSFTIAFFAAYIYIRYSPPIYKVSSLLLIKEESSPVANLLDELKLFKENKKLANEIALISSYDMVYNTIKQLDFQVSYFHKGQVRNVELYKELPYKVFLDTSYNHINSGPYFVEILSDSTFKLSRKESAGDKIYKFGEPLNTHSMNFTIHRNPEVPYVRPPDVLYFIIHDQALLANAYKNKVYVSKYYKESTLLEISCQGQIPQKEIDFVNKLAEVYIQTGFNEKNQTANKTIQFIDEQLSGIITSLSSAETEWENFQKDNKILDFKYTTTAIFQKLEAHENEKAILLVRVQYYDYLMGYLKEEKDLGAIVAPSAIGISDALLNDLIAQLSNLHNERASLSRSIGLKNPYLSSLDLKIKNVKETLIENLKNIIKQNEISLNDLNRRMDLVNQEIRKLPKTERKLVDIQRKFNLNNHIYNYLMEKRAEAGIARAANLADNKVVDKAKMLNAIQISPRTNIIYSIAGLLALMLPLFIILARKFFSDKIISLEQVKEMTEIPILGIVGHNKFDKNNIVVKDRPKSAISEAFRSIRINLNYLSPDIEKKIITISSSISGEGKTFCSINLAIILAMSDKKTLLIGADLRKPKIYTDFGITNNKGLSTYLSNKADLDEIINKTDLDNLDIIVAGDIPPNPGELLGIPRMELLLTKMKQTYDFIILDTPPLGLVADSFLLMKYSHINIYIIRYKYTSKKMLERIETLSNEGKINNLGIILNDLSDEKTYGYNYGYGYGYSYYNHGYYSDDIKKAWWKRLLRNK